MGAGPWVEASAAELQGCPIVGPAPIVKVFPAS